MDKMRSLGITACLLFAFAGVVSAQISPTSVPNGTVGAFYSVNLTESEQFGVAPVTWNLSSGSLPPGLTLDTSTTNTTTTISGTPTTPGFYSFQVAATYNESANTTDTQNYTIDICTPTLTPSSASPLPPGEVNLVYQQLNFKVSGCSGTYTFSQGDPFEPSTLPPGLTLTSTGALEGTPTKAGPYSFPITITDQDQNQTQFQYSLTIYPPPAITNASPLPNGPVGVPYSQQITASGGVSPYIFSSSGILPPGLTFPASGLLSGTPKTAGTYDFNLAVTDNIGGQSVLPFQVTFATAVSQIQVTPLSLTFNATAGAGPPPTQSISLTPATGTTPPVTYRVVVDNGQSGGAAPSWITVTPTSGGVPAGLVVSVDQGSMTAGAYPARIQVLDGNGFPTDVGVTLNVAKASQQLDVAPATLSFAARSSTPGNLIGQLVVSSSGVSSVGFTASSVNNSSWIESITASSNTTARNAPVFVQVEVNTTGLQTGVYQDAIQLSSSAGNVKVPVSLFVAASGPILAVNTTGVLFQAVQGGGSTATQIVKVLNLGDSSSTVHWTASLVSGSNWLSLVSSSGTATSGNPGALTLALASNATQLSAGPYYSIIKITDSNSRNSPQYVSAVLNLQPAGTAPAPGLAPVGLFFTTALGGSAPSPQQVQINTSSSSAVTYNATASTFGTGTWLTVTPASGNASGQTAGSVAVSVNPSGLGAGIYSGDVNVSIGALLQSVNVTFVVQPASSNATARVESEPASERPQAVGCSPSKLAITETGLANNFAIPAGWPATLTAQLNDDCSSPVTNGNVVATFSNGDPALNLAADALGNYSSTWQPRSTNANMVVTLNATAGSLQPATAKLYGGIAANQTPPPVVNTNGTVNNLNSVGGAPLAPGTIAALYGSGLYGASSVLTSLPLPKSVNGTFALIGDTEAPLYYVSGLQLDLQIPFEATATQQVPIILSVNNALSLPQMLNIIPTAPGVAAAMDGTVIAQHGVGSAPITSASPAKPGEIVVIYLVGMGATDANPPVATGAVSPSSPPANVIMQPIVTVASQQAVIKFAGLTPGSVGLYQIDFQVPTSVSSGNLPLTVTQNGIAANTTSLPVSN